MRLLGEDSAKVVETAFVVTTQLESADEQFSELRRLWEMAKVSLPDEPGEEHIDERRCCQSRRLYF